MACPDGLYFSPQTGDCEWPFDVPECQAGTPPPPTRSPGYLEIPANYRNAPREYIQYELEKSKWYKKQQDPCLNQGFGDY